MNKNSKERKSIINIKPRDLNFLGLAPKEKFDYAHPDPTPREVAAWKNSAHLLAGKKGQQRSEKKITEACKTICHLQFTDTHGLAFMLGLSRVNAVNLVKKMTKMGLIKTVLVGDDVVHFLTEKGEEFSLLAGVSGFAYNGCPSSVRAAGAVRERLAFTRAFPKAIEKLKFYTFTDSRAQGHSYRFTSAELVGTMYSQRGEELMCRPDMELCLHYESTFDGDPHRCSVAVEVELTGKKGWEMDIKFHRLSENFDFVFFYCSATAFVNAVQTRINAGSVPIYRKRQQGAGFVQVTDGGRPVVHQLKKLQFHVEKMELGKCFSLPRSA